MEKKLYKKHNMSLRICLIIAVIAGFICLTVYSCINLYNNFKNTREYEYLEQFVVYQNYEDVTVNEDNPYIYLINPESNSKNNICMTYEIMNNEGNVILDETPYIQPSYSDYYSWDAIKCLSDGVYDLKFIVRTYLADKNMELYEINQYNVLVNVI